jgi:DNA polymerase-3 subunit alpha
MINSFVEDFQDYDIPLHGVRLPTMEIDQKVKQSLGIKPSSLNKDVLRALCMEGFTRLQIKDKKYNDRLDYELSVIEELGFVDYILLVWDIINYCKLSDIAVGAGRGSAAGSLVLYTIGVTGLDPIKYDLYFERFISKIRAKKHVKDGITYLDGSLMCDIDMDICYYNRSKVLKYLEEKFKGKTCKILTFNTLQGKLLIKECGKIIAGLSEDDVKAVASLIPEIFGKVRDIELVRDGKKEGDKVVYEPVEEFRRWTENYPEVYKTALKLRNLVKNKSVHASAMLLSFDPVDESIPVEFSAQKEAVSSYDMNWATLANVKLDLLGLRSVSVVSQACKLIGISQDKIDLNDPFIYQNLQELKTPHGLFQIEADTVYRAIKKIKPKNLEELSGVLAIARPGAMDFIDDYANYTTSGTAQSIHPFFDDVLGATGGLCLYQEQLLKMANKVGFSLDEAEIIRRVVGKKKVKEMAEWEQKVKDKVKERGLDPTIADVLWKILDASKDYSFNKSHSMAYAALAAVTTYLKFKYPQMFFLSLLMMTRNESEPVSEVAKIHKELEHFNIKLLPPHILKSQLDFSIEEHDIRFGLLSIKGISDKSIEKITSFRHPHSNKFEIFQAATECKLGIGILSSLIQAGAMADEMPGKEKASRSRVVLEAQLWNLLTDNEKKFCLERAEKFDFNLTSIIKSLLTELNEKNKPLIKASRFETIKKKYQPYLEIYTKNKEHEAFANWYYERTLLGYAYFTTLKEIFSEFTYGLMTVREVLAAPLNSKVKFIGVGRDAYTGTSKKKTKYFKLVVADETDEITALVFDTGYALGVEKCKEINGGLPKDDNIVIVTGTKKEDAIFAEDIVVQDKKVYTKLKDLKSKHDEKEVKEEVKELENKPEPVPAN